MKRNRTFMRVVQKQTGKTAIAMRAKSGCVLVQFNDMAHPHAYGWTLYPRHHFVRRRK